MGTRNDKRVVLNTKTVKALKTDNPHGERLYDTVLQGFSVVVYPSGKRTFWVRYRPNPGRPYRWLKVGPYPTLTAEQAREEARKLLAKATVGEDPAEERDARAGAVTFSEWVVDYLEVIRPRKKIVRFDEAFLNFTATVWGNRLLDDISVEDVERLMQVVRREGIRAPGKKGKAARCQEMAVERQRGRADRNTLANRWLASVRACFKDAWRKGKIKDLPAHKVKLLRENPPRNRVLSYPEQVRALKAIQELENPFDRAALMLLYDTGARSSEVLRARWKDIDLHEGKWTVPSPKAGNPITKPLLESTVKMLEELPRLGPFVIPGRRTKDEDGRVVERGRADLHAAWGAVKEAAGIPDDAHIHDIRRTYGLEAMVTVGPFPSSKLMGHSSPEVTAKVYAPLTTKDLRGYAEKVDKARNKAILRVVNGGG